MTTSEKKRVMARNLIANLKKERNYFPYQLGHFSRCPDTDDKSIKTCRCKYLFLRDTIHDRNPSEKGIWKLRQS